MTDVLDNPTLAEQMALKLEEEVIRLNREIVLLVKQKEAIAKRNAVLVEEKNEIELRLSKQILSIHESYLDRICALEAESDRLNNFIAGHVVQRDQEYENLRSNVSYLMGADRP